LPQPQTKASFLLPSDSSDWAGQALHAWFPDGLLAGAAKASLTPLTGWTRRRDPLSLQELKNQIRLLGGTHIRLRAEGVKDWVHDYKSRFPRQQLGRFVVLPSWRRHAKLSKGSLPIVLLPGQAFGTGLHASTRLMLASIESLEPQGKVLDIGAGSGILGLACLRLGAAKVLSIEMEEAACEEMRGNAKLNGFGPGRFAVRHGSFPKAMGAKAFQADLVLANIVTPVLCALMRAMVARVAKGGTLLFSGIHTKAEAAQVARAAGLAGLRIASRTSKGEWWCLRAVK
jgi:ribosomal protein L11 methyltransferase